MVETFGRSGPESILNKQQGLRRLLESKGWKSIKYGYAYLNVKQTFLGGLFKSRVYQIVLENKGIESSIIHTDENGILGEENKYKVKLGKAETEWKDVKDFKNIKKHIRNNKIENILN